MTPEHLEWTGRSVDLANVAARSVSVTWTPGGENKPPEPPASIALPLSLRLRNLAVGELRLGERGQEPQVLRDVRLQGDADRESIRIEQASARYGPSDATLAGTVGTSRPFPLSAHAELHSVVLDRPIKATLDASGSLVDMTLVAKSDGEAGRVDAAAELAPFGAVPLVALSLAVADLLPEQWVPGVPAMKLTAAAELKPGPVRASRSRARSR